MVSGLTSLYRKRPNGKADSVAMQLSLAPALPSSGTIILIYCKIARKLRDTYREELLTDCLFEDRFVCSVCMEPSSLEVPGWE